MYSRTQKKVSINIDYDAVPLSIIEVKNCEIFTSFRMECASTAQELRGTKFSGRYRQSSNHTEVLSLASQAWSRMTELQKQTWAPHEMTNVKKNSLEFSSPYHFTDFGSVKPTMQSPQTFIDIPGLVELGNPVTNLLQ